jgi:hypothetical protein
MEMSEQKLNFEDGILYMCVYKGTNLGVFSESSIKDLKETNINEFIQNYTKMGTPELFLEQLEILEKTVRDNGKDANCLSSTERNMACLNIISLVKAGRLKNNEMFGYIKMICKDKKVVIHMDE